MEVPHSSGAAAIGRWHRYLLTLLLFVLVFPIIGQSQTIVYDQLWAPVVTVTPGDHVYRIHSYQNTDPTSFNGSVEFNHPLGLFTTPLLGFRDIRVLTSPTDLLAGNTYVAQNDPVLTYLSTATQVGSTILSPNPTALDVSSALATPQTISGLVIPNGHYVYVVEHFETQICIGSNSSALTSLLNVIFDDGTPNTFSLPNSGTINLSTPLTPSWEITMNPTAQAIWSGLPTHENNLTQAGNCQTGTQVARRMRYTFKDGALFDPHMSYTLNQDGPITPNLLEVDPADVYISFELDLDGDGIINPLIDMVAYNITLADLENSGNIYNIIDEDRTDCIGNTIQPGPGQIAFNALTSAVDEWPVPLPIGFGWNKPSNTLHYIPSLALPASNGNTATRTLHSFNLNFSRLDLSSFGGINTAANYDLFYGPNPPLGWTFEDAHITIYEDSWIEIDYRGTFVPSDLMDPSWCNFQCEQGQVNDQTAVFRGFDLCYEPLQPSFTPLELNGAYAPNQINLIAPIPQQQGENDNLVSTWDGTTYSIEHNLATIGGTHANLVNALQWDYACSALEFEIEMQQGLAPICPNNTDGSVVYNNLGGCNPNDPANFGLASGVDYYNNALPTRAYCAHRCRK